MSFHDLRGFLSVLERNGRLQRVGEPVDPDLETTSLSLRALRNGGPALLIAPDDGALIQGPLPLDTALGKAFKSVTGPG